MGQQICYEKRKSCFVIQQKEKDLGICEILDKLLFSGSLKTLVKGVSSASSQSRLPRWLAGNGNQWETQRKVGNKKTMGSHRF